MSGTSRRVESPLSSRISGTWGWFYAQIFTYFNIAISAGPEAYSAAVSWKTTAISSTKVRYREVGAEDWIELEETDLDPRVLIHD